jgi:ABC-type tungstate transport system permease subunit
LHQGDPRLLNHYSVLHPVADTAARHLATWLVSDDGRALISGFTIGGKPMFTVPPARE